MPIAAPAAATVACVHCGGAIHQWNHLCPHCGRPVGYPNVRAAESESPTLERRYLSAIETLRTRGGYEAGMRFEHKVQTESRAVVNRTPAALLNMLNSEVDAFAPFSTLVEAGFRAPDASEFDQYRERVDAAFFPNYHRDMRFAALSLRPDGLSNYGSCCITIKESLIAHRATVFDQNTLIWLLTHNPPPNEMSFRAAGHRATWGLRGQLALAKKASVITGSMTDESFRSLLLSVGSDSRSDDFLEVHIWGEMSVQCIEHVHLLPGSEDMDELYRRILGDKLEKLGIPVSGAIPT